MTDNRIPTVLLLAVLVLLAFGYATEAQDYPGPETTHDINRVAMREARNELHVDGCVTTKDKRVARTTKQRQSRDVNRVDQATWAVTCTQWRNITAPIVIIDPGPFKVGVAIDWPMPTLRENGDAVTPGEIARVEFHVTDAEGVTTVYTAPGDTTHWEQDLVPGTYYIQMLVVDSDGLRSDKSKAIEVVITE